MGQVSEAVQAIATKAKESEFPQQAKEYATNASKKCCDTVKETMPVVEIKAAEASKAVQEGAMKLRDQAKEQIPVMQEKAAEASKAVQEQAKEQMPLIQEKAKETGAMIQEEARVVGEYIRQESGRLSETDFAQHVKDVANQIQESVNDLVEEGRKFVDAEMKYPAEAATDAEMEAAAIAAAQDHVDRIERAYGHVNMFCLSLSCEPNKWIMNS